MQKQFLAAILTAAVLLVGFMIVPSQFAAIAQEEEVHEHPVETAIEVFADTISDTTEAAVADIIKDDPELSDAVEETAAAVEADPAFNSDVKPEIDSAIVTFEDAVSESGTEPTDVFVNLSDNTTTTEVLLTLASLDDTTVLENLVTATVTTEVINSNANLTEAFNVEICGAVNDFVSGESTLEEAAADLEAGIEAAVEANVTVEDVQNAEAAVTEDDVIVLVESGEADVTEAVATTVEVEIEGPEVVITPVPDTDHSDNEGNKDAHETIIAQNERIIELLEQLVAAPTQ